MWHVARYRGCMECLVALLVLQIELAMAFLHIPRTRGDCIQFVAILTYIDPLR